MYIYKNKGYQLLQDDIIVYTFSVHVHKFYFAYNPQMTSPRSLTRTPSCTPSLSVATE